MTEEETGTLSEIKDSALLRYDAARSALKSALDVDEVKGIRDKSAALAEYARQAKDSILIEYATEIRVRAERRLGEMTAQIPTAQGRRTSPAEGDKLNGSPSKAEILKSIGISTQQASRFEKLADISEKKFEEAVAAAKQTAREVTERAVLQATTPKRPADATSVVNAKPDPKDATIAALEAEVSKFRSLLLACQTKCGDLIRQIRAKNDE